MALEINTEIIINASPTIVWQILTNFEDYPNWNPFIKSIVGDLCEGEIITIEINSIGDKKTTFRPRIKTLVVNKELSWLGQLVLPRIIDGYHKFELIDNGNKTTSFIHSEKFTGILVPLVKNQLKTNIRQGFCNMNEKIKELAEKA